LKGTNPLCCLCHLWSSQASAILLTRDATEVGRVLTQAAHSGLNGLSVVSVIFDIHAFHATHTVGEGHG